MSWMELAKDVWDLDDDQMFEMLEALQTKMAQREGVTPQGGLSQGNLRDPGGTREGSPDNREDGPRWEEGWRYSELLWWQQTPFNLLEMLAISVASSSSLCLWGVVSPSLGLPRVLLSSSLSGDWNGNLLGLVAAFLVFWVVLLRWLAFSD